MLLKYSSCTLLNLCLNKSVIWAFMYGSRVLWWVDLFVCTHTSLIFCAHYPWLSPPPAALWYVLPVFWMMYLQCFDAVVEGHPACKKLEWWGAGVVICLEQGADLWPSWCHCHSLSLASVKSRLVLPSWYWLTRVVLGKGLFSVCVCSTIVDDVMLALQCIRLHIPKTDSPAGSFRLGA